MEAEVPDARLADAQLIDAARRIAQEADSAEIYQDSGAPKNVSITRLEVDRNTHLRPKLAEGGGYAVRFVKK